ncbi:hypothetical protein [Actinobacillus equuli]|uniref:hypothetical protein n=1 Tax=Actinobacillus equuli TaxID=718 RepID=UPI002441E6DC|nr:hypothetical protein [Actinobacillus equuli]WGE56928.1 hypothetical protein NYR71_09460 [Actinobacillus equuli subsp. equuli]
MFEFPSDIKKAIKSNYQREYNCIFIIVGLSTIIGIIFTVFSSFLLLSYLVSINARNLFIHSLENNFSTIFIPIALFLFFPIALINIQPIKYASSIKEKKNTSKHNILITLGIMEIVYIPLILLTILFHETNLKIILINLPIVITYFYLLVKIKDSIDMANYLFFTSTTYLLVPFCILIYNGGTSTITDIKFISIYLCLMLTGSGLGFFFVRNINKKQNPTYSFYLITSISILFLISINPLLEINFKENSLTMLGIRENTPKNYLIHKQFFYESNSSFKKNMKENDYYITCGRKLFENAETLVLEIENHTYQIPNKYINNEQNYENKNSQPNNASKCNS